MAYLVIMTDREVEMKAHMHKLHEQAISEKLLTNHFVKRILG